MRPERLRVRPPRDGILFVEEPARELAPLEPLLVVVDAESSFVAQSDPGLEHVLDRGAAGSAEVVEYPAPVVSRIESNRIELSWFYREKSLYCSPSDKIGRNLTDRHDST